MPCRRYRRLCEHILVHLPRQSAWFRQAAPPLRAYSSPGPHLVSHLPRCEDLRILCPIASAARACTCCVPSPPLRGLAHFLVSACQPPAAPPLSRLLRLAQSRAPRFASACDERYVHHACPSSFVHHACRVLRISGSSVMTSSGIGVGSRRVPPYPAQAL